MNNVHSAMADASPDQLDKLRNAALQLGPAMGKSAIEAAGAIEALAKNGMDAADILSGGLEAALKLGVWVRPTRDLRRTPRPISFSNSISRPVVCRMSSTR